VGALTGKSEEGAADSSALGPRPDCAEKLGIKAHARMLRHACGYKLAHDGHNTRASFRILTRHAVLAQDWFKIF
jgi:hypothetical protein